MTMKLSTVAKTSLALGILTAGIVTTKAQSVDAAEEQVAQNKISTEELKSYYSKIPFELRNVKGDREGNIIKIIDRGQVTNVKLVDKDKDNLKLNNISNIDVFVVKENNSKFSETETIGGISESSKTNYKDWSVNPTISLKSTNGSAIFQRPVGNLPILKDKVTLKELDFRLRNELIKNHDLYTNGNNGGVITVHMKDKNIEDNYYSFVLDNKLQEHRMGNVIDATQIDRIDVEYKE
ncbi:superantigen-like protein [Staphylococcus agnetis]|uniref:Superantigen-like protein n=2 Tax=Staphylococcus agnetis TaxID=985762 RepID=A0A2T4MD00_9STAP|nr:superantigen-like protein [Staphylococcus agnetis]PTH26524.1 superantigen-like protein [Staphylococcus agnetis]PTH38183.1 superantigen-like protein [Staphylococcus agnetis]